MATLFLACSTSRQGSQDITKAFGEDAFVELLITLYNIWRLGCLFVSIAYRLALHIHGMGLLR
jgi:hypothetical protein